MSKPDRIKAVVQRPRADADIDDIFRWLQGESPQAAMKFLDAVRAAYDVISTYPASGSKRHARYCPELPHALRFHPLAGFPRILVYYMDRPDAVEVIRVWDAARGLDTLMAEQED